MSDVEDIWNGVTSRSAFSNQRVIDDLLLSKQKDSDDAKELMGD